MMEAATERDRFCVLYQGMHGPRASFWPSMALVVKLLAGYCNSECGKGITVWQRTSARGRWKLISNAD